MNNRIRVSRIDLAPLGGIAGDMFAAAMFDAFPELYEGFQQDLKQLNISGLAAQLEERLSNGLRASYFRVVQQTDQHPPRTLSGVTKFLSGKHLDANVVKHAVGLFTLLAGAEAQVHGKSIETIHFHEVSDWDSIVDLVAAAGIISRLDCQYWRVGALPLGSGTVNTAHGDITVPAPATLALLNDFKWHDDGIGGERVTPTGAAILAYLKAQPSTGSAPEAALVTTGTGCGTREMQGRANVLRAIAFSESAGSVDNDEVVRIAFEVDDMTAEEISWATDLVREHEGVVDVSSVVLQAKKGRLSTGIRIIAQPSKASLIMNRCFEVTSTLGLRYESVNRRLLRRETVRVDYPLPAASPEQEGTKLHVKRTSRPKGDDLETHTAKTESDDLISCNTLQERRQLAVLSETSALNERSNRSAREGEE